MGDSKDLKKTFLKLCDDLLESETVEICRTGHFSRYIDIAYLLVDLVLVIFNN